MKLSEDLQYRGLIKDKTFEDDTWLDTPRTFYLGVDPSADSLTIGNLAVFLLAKRLQQAGWRAVLLVGGATSLIGDPGGKDSERDLKSHDEIAANVRGVRAQVERLFEGRDFTLVNNYDWQKDVGLLEFLRDIGKHFSMTELLNREFIADRLGEDGNGISYAEFSYTLIQGYDFWYLNKNHGVELQIGGSDQWGNMLSGVPLIRKREGREVQAFSMPLVIDKTTGRKFGKSEGGAVWLDAAKTTPTQFYQFWINCDDTNVEDYLKIYTELPREAIDELVLTHRQDPQQRLAQKRLAHEVTRTVHGDEQTALAERVTGYLTGAEALNSLDEASLQALRQEIASVRSATDGSIIEALVAGGLASSNSEARRLLQGNAVSVSGQKVNREHFEATDFQNGRLLLKKGKKYKDTALVEQA